MKFKKAASLVMAGMLLTAALPAMTACSDSEEERAKQMFDFGDGYYQSVSTRHKLNYDEMLYDDFTNGIDLDRWVVSDSVWDQWSTDQNGVRPQNVFVVDDKDNPDTHLLLRANGSYYNMNNDALYTEEEKKQYGDGKTLFTAAQGYGINSGACISTTEALGPGRYDIKMKACPRVGALTSMWAYSWFTLDDGSTQQNEIDIEIGLKPDFSQVFFTTWTAPSRNTNMPTPIDFYANDGEWHIYSFDWVTDTAVPYVDYYIDGVKVLTIDSNVPTTNATLNIGMWLPSWAGGGANDPENGNISVDSRMFDTDFAEISWWRYIPFQMDGWEQRPVQNRNFADGYIPKTLTSVPTVNKCANGDFERNDYGAYGNPWKDYTVTDEDNETYISGSSAGSFAETVNDVTNTCAKIVNGGLLGQWLRGATTGFKYRLTGKYRTTDGATAAFRYTYLIGYSITSRTNGNKNVTIGSSDEWKDFTLDFSIEKEGIQSIRYYLLNSAGTGTCYFDDLSLTYLGH